MAAGCAPEKFRSAGTCLARPRPRSDDALPPGSAVLGSPIWFAAACRTAAGSSHQLVPAKAAGARTLRISAAASSLAECLPARARATSPAHREAPGSPNKQWFASRCESRCPARRKPWPDIRTANNGTQMPDPYRMIKSHSLFRKSKPENPGFIRISFLANFRHEN